MISRYLKKPLIYQIAFFLTFLVGSSLAEEKIVQEETIEFDKCLKVISVSEDKLSIAPEISDIKNKKRVATFVLPDGILKITCDGHQKKVIVSTSIP